ncbi:glycosyltransferase family 4 protein [Herbiconiux sp. VKM Ac-2851]|uniref:glycosyltransferase family 4 protein n=1 Tax=Herbiconiux sp. VKM Ac-2851 TaxID=2739025 RepID=UPI00156416F0|nr:glycosyltransferase family 4 protein [Herbiconiux sp. VKM Ac-2851]NQX35585.1 glycosyltransferase family 4 protein [Herbiconiux sp. VKM Ac-2851]
MKVLLAHPGSELYGSDRMAVAAVAALVEAGHVVTVVIPDHGPLRGLLVEAGAAVEVVELPVLRKALLHPRPLAGLLARMPRTLTLARRIIVKRQIDVVYANTITQPWWLVAARLSGRAALVHVREAETEVPVIAQRLLLAPLTLAHLAIANSESTKQHVVQRGFRMGAKTRVVYNGKEWSSYFRSSFAGISAKPQLLFVGRLSPRKGPDVAIRSLALLLARGVDARLTIVGSIFPGYEWYDAELRKLADESGVSDRVEFAGFTSDAAPYFARADVIVVPSRIEPFGTVAAEGMAAERPTVVSEVQGLVEIVHRDEVGLTFPVGDPEKLADVLERIIGDPELARRVAEEGRRSVLERFSTEAYSRGIVSAVAEACALRSGRRQKDRT